MVFIEVMNNEMTSRHGVPERLLSDQGFNFISGLVWFFYETLGVKKLFGAAYHRALQRHASGNVTNVRQRVPDRLGSLLAPCAVRLPDLFREVLGDSPFFRLHGRDPVLPLDLAFLNTSNEWKSNEAVAYRRRLVLYLRDTRQMVGRQLLKAQGRHQRRLGGQHEVKLEEGYPVWVYQYFRAKRGERRTKKLAFAWHGPCGNGRGKRLPSSTDAPESSSDYQRESVQDVPRPVEPTFPV
ncbi:hypothetical protein PC129_g18652 [Phytophthora cactorum]|uniref:Integrase catalytic domain-containing protein n=1 Tax=Phytophthora cactorum TaxID=29920 RepID=A0A329S5G7_9STRA|nr:hypothetical protein Pcac1_g21219 [Phytophthora cactorum]KAG2878953.1 hypothetical protein PC114_g22827 [Phytophthora cactorum]KAG2898359.1 hypothetical protein PC117_g22560 [Phytophthora cactorum]KAG2976061.1 hypothetical protein PC119_g22300 [Phytophthora cactorum]KAG3132007.1 hypothetical protein C6341_g23097 [Phytophthora cactorum]